ncbi:MAG: hypothetical protein LBS82_00385, partial [Spirochaetaceae bacterium]|nr:hypothetical protein [Spirochaetaceae bacterium]
MFFAGLGGGLENALSPKISLLVLEYEAFVLEDEVFVLEYEAFVLEYEAFVLEDDGLVREGFQWASVPAGRRRVIIYIKMRRRSREGVVYELHSEARRRIRVVVRQLCTAGGAPHEWVAAGLAAHSAEAKEGLMEAHGRWQMAYQDG